MYVFWNIDFGRISEGFWKGFGKPKSDLLAQKIEFKPFVGSNFAFLSIFASFSMDFGGLNPWKYQFYLGKINIFTSFQFLLVTSPKHQKNN